MKKRACAGIFLLLFIILGMNGFASSPKDMITGYRMIFYIPAVAVEAGGEKEAVLDSLSSLQFTFYTEIHGTVSIPVEWNLSSLDTSQTGVYTIVTKITTPEGYELADGVELPQYTTQVSVQRKTQPEINAYSRMVSVGLYFFPWLERSNTDDMTVWLQKEGEGWSNLSDTGYAMCEPDGMYLSNLALSTGSIYHLTVAYGQQNTRILTFRYGSDRNLSIISYLTGSVGSTVVQESCINSIEQVDANLLNRFNAWAVPVQGDLTAIIKQVESEFYLQGSTSTVFEDTPAHPAVELDMTCETSTVNLQKPGVYPLVIQFSVPDGYTKNSDLMLPSLTVYVSVQESYRPQVNTYYFESSDAMLFPMLLSAFSENGFTGFSVYLKENEGSFRCLPENVYRITERGLYLDIPKVFSDKSSYQIYVEYPGGSTDIYSFVFHKDMLTDESVQGRNYADVEQDVYPDIEQTEKPETESTEKEAAESEETDAVPETEAAKQDAFKVPEEEPESEQPDEYVEKGSDGNGTGNGNTGSGNEEAAAKPVTEVVSEKQTIISGKRLKLLAEDGAEAIHFDKNGVSLYLPVVLVTSWNISDSEQFRTIIQKDEGNLITIKLFRGDEEITEIPGSYLEIAESSLEETLCSGNSVVTDAGGVSTKAEWNAELHLLHIDIETTGTYTLSAISAEEEAQTEEIQTEEIQTEETRMEEAQTEKETEEIKEIEDSETRWGLFGSVAVIILVFSGAFLGMVRKRGGGNQS